MDINNTTNDSTKKTTHKYLFITEKPSVAAEYAKALGMPLTRSNGCYENDKYVVTWCVGHLVTLCYPEAYDAKYKIWALATLPFIPNHYKYQVSVHAKLQK